MGHMHRRTVDASKHGNSIMTQQAGSRQIVDTALNLSIGHRNGPPVCKHISHQVQGTAPPTDHLSSVCVPALASPPWTDSDPVEKYTSLTPSTSPLLTASRV